MNILNQSADLLIVVLDPDHISSDETASFGSSIATALTNHFRQDVSPCPIGRALWDAKHHMIYQLL